MKQLTELTTSFTSVADSIDLPGQDLSWIQEIRQQALAQFNQSGFPSKKVEDWKYTSLWELTQLQFSHLVEPEKLVNSSANRLLYWTMLIVLLSLMAYFLLAYQN